MTYQDNIIFQLDLLHRKFMLKANTILREEAEIKAGSFFMLVHLCNTPSDNHKMISQELHYERSTISRAMQVMSEKKYVAPIKSNDQRCNVYRVTNLGRELVRKYMPKIKKLHDQLLVAEPDGSASLTHAYVAIKDYNERNN